MRRDSWRSVPFAQLLHRLERLRAFAVLGLGPGEADERLLAEEAAVGVGHGAVVGDRLVELALV